MERIRIFDGSQTETPLFHVFLSALRGPRALRVTVAAERNPDAGVFHASDVAVRKALKHMKAPESAFVAVYRANPVPPVSGRYGAPLGRRSDNLDADAPNYRACRVELDSGGYDRGGAYWGCRPDGESIYAVQDGMGGVAFIDATSRADAIRQAKGLE